VSGSAGGSSGPVRAGSGTTTMSARESRASVARSAGAAAVKRAMTRVGRPADSTGAASSRSRSPAAVTAMSSEPSPLASSNGVRDIGSSRTSTIRAGRWLPARPEPSAARPRAPSSPASSGTDTSTPKASASPSSARSAAATSRAMIRSG